MKSLTYILFTLRESIHALLELFAHKGIALDSELSLVPPQFRIFTSPEIFPFGIVQLVEAAYILGTFVVIAVLVRFLRWHPFFEGGRLSWFWDSG
jgi:hypothetical protein